MFLEKFKGSNNINFSKYLNNRVKPEHITYKKLLGQSQLNTLNDMKDRLTKYRKEIKLFEKGFALALGESVFEFSIVSLVMMEREDFEKFEQERNKCPNMVDILLFHGTAIEPLSYILTDMFRKPGIYYTLEEGYILLLILIIGFSEILK